MELMPHIKALLDDLIKMTKNIVVKRTDLANEFEGTGIGLNLYRNSKEILEGNTIFNTYTKYYVDVLNSYCVWNIISNNSIIDTIEYENNTKYIINNGDNTITLVSEESEIPKDINSTNTSGEKLINTVDDIDRYEINKHTAGDLYIVYNRNNMRFYKLYKNAYDEIEIFVGATDNDNNILDFMRYKDGKASIYNIQNLQLYIKLNKDDKYYIPVTLNSGTEYTDSTDSKNFYYYTDGVNSGFDTYNNIKQKMDNDTKIKFYKFSYDSLIDKYILNENGIYYLTEEYQFYYNSPEYYSDTEYVLYSNKYSGDDLYKISDSGIYYKSEDFETGTHSFELISDLEYNTMEEYNGIRYAKRERYDNIQYYKNNSMDNYIPLYYENEYGEYYYDEKEDTFKVISNDINPEIRYQINPRIEEMVKFEISDTDKNGYPNIINGAYYYNYDTGRFKLISDDYRFEYYDITNTGITRYFDNEKYTIITENDYNKLIEDETINKDIFYPNIDIEINESETITIKNHRYELNEYIKDSFNKGYSSIAGLAIAGISVSGYSTLENLLISRYNKLDLYVTVPIDDTIDFLISDDGYSKTAVKDILNNYVCYNRIDPNIVELDGNQLYFYGYDEDNILPCKIQIIPNKISATYNSVTIGTDKILVPSTKKEYYFKLDDQNIDCEYFISENSKDFETLKFTEKSDGYIICDKEDNSSTKIGPYIFGITNPTSYNYQQVYTEDQSLDYYYDKNIIPLEDRDSIKLLMDYYVLSQYVPDRNNTSYSVPLYTGETNDYYRELNGLPLTTSTADSVPRINRLSINPTYEGTDTNPYIYQLSDYEISLMEESGELDKYKKLYPNSKYLNHLGKYRIDVIQARDASPYDILLINSPDMILSGKLFNENYNIARNYILKRYYHPNMFGMQEYYHAYIAFLICVLTLLMCISKSGEILICNKYMDQKTVDLMLESYGFKGTFDSIPLIYRREIAKSIGKLIKNKGIDNIYELIYKLFDIEGLEVYKYFFKKNTNNEIDIVQSPINSTDIINDLLDSTNKLSYDEITGKDGYWGVYVSKEEIENKIKNLVTNYMNSKYISLNNKFNLTELNFNSMYLLNYLIETTRLLKTDSEIISINGIKNPQSIANLIICLFAMQAIKYNYDGNIPNDIVSAAAIYKFNLTEEITGDNGKISKIFNYYKKYITKKTENNIDRMITNIHNSSPRDVNITSRLNNQTSAIYTSKNDKTMNDLSKRYMSNLNDTFIGDAKNPDDGSLYNPLIQLRDNAKDIHDFLCYDQLLTCISTSKSIKEIYSLPNPVYKLICEMQYNSTDDGIKKIDNDILHYIDIRTNMEEIYDKSDKTRTTDIFELLKTYINTCINDKSLRYYKKKIGGYISEKTIDNMSEDMKNSIIVDDTKYVLLFSTKEILLSKDSSNNEIAIITYDKPSLDNITSHKVSNDNILDKIIYLHTTTTEDRMIEISSILDNNTNELKLSSSIEELIDNLNIYQLFDMLHYKKNETEINIEDFMTIDSKEDQTYYYTNNNKTVKVRISQKTLENATSENLLSDFNDNDLYIEIYPDKTIDNRYHANIYRKCDYALTYNMYLQYCAPELYDYIQPKADEDPKGSVYKDRLKQFTSTIIATLEDAIEDTTLISKLKLSYSDFENIASYIRLVLNVFKSYTIDLSSMNMIYTVDDKSVNRVKILDMYYSDEKYLLNDMCKIIMDMICSEENYENKDILKIRDEIFITEYI